MCKNNKCKFFAKENWTKKKVISGLKKYLVLTIANIILAFVAVMFLKPLNIVSGGLTGIAIIIDQFIEGEWLDIICYIGEAILIILSFVFLGKKVTFKSLFSCIVYPLFMTLFTRVIPLDIVVDMLYGGNGTGTYTLVQDTSLLLLGALVGGIGVGLAVGLAFMVRGSTAGIDTIVLIIKKYQPKLKESVLCFILDSTIIFAGIICSFCTSEELSSYNVIMCIINIMTAILTAVTIEIIYIMRNSSVTITVISSKWEEINEYIIKTLDRGCTVYDVFGGFQLEKRRELKTVVTKKQSETAKEEILNIDPNCFLTMTVSKGVFGEGFQNRFSDD